MRRLIKRYSNRKLYDQVESRYVTLEDIYNFVRAGGEVVVIDAAEASLDITSTIMLRALLDQGEKLGKVLTTEILTSVIKQGDGTLNGFIAAK